MLNKQEPDILYQETGLFPTLMVEPWRAEELIEKEITIQRYRLFRAIAWTHIGLAFILGLFVLFKSRDITTLIITVCYFMLLIALMALTAKNRKYTLRYSFLMALLDIFVLGYMTLFSNSSISLALLFFSILLSAMLLTLPRLLITVALAAGVVLLSWSDFSGVALQRFYSNKLDWESVQHYAIISGNSQKKEELILLLTGLIILAITTNQLAIWSFKNEVKAQFRYKQLRQLLAFNRSVIEHLKNGVLVLTTHDKVISINQRALDLLNHNSSDAIIDLSDLSDELASRHRYWQSTGLEISQAYRHNDYAEEVFVSFSGFGDKSQRNITMMTLESVNDTLQQSQEAKLSALGRLTAGVAHEIRNPLSSIGSAAQLLTETSRELSHQKLSNLILKNVKRTNQIINDILGLFKETRSERQLLPLEETLQQFCQEFIQTHTDDRFDLKSFGEDEPPLFFLFDKNQFEQILWNLVQNAVKYANVEPLEITITYRLSLNRKNIYIDVVDNGVGIDSQKVSQIFEPFFTGGSSGSGLGLYLVRELCHANGAHIMYLAQKKAEDDNKGAHFRITTQAFFSKRIKPNIS